MKRYAEKMIELLQMGNTSKPYKIDRNYYEWFINVFDAINTGKYNI